MIRAATVADAPDIARVHVATWRVAYAGLMPDEYLAAMSVPAGTSRWEGHLAAPGVATHVATENGTVVGFASAGPARDADADDSSGEVYAVYVDPAAQRRGLGTALLGAATASLGAQGRRTALLWVLTGNAPARAFYTARGGVEDGAARTIDLGGATADEVRYRFVLVPAT